MRTLDIRVNAEKFGADFKDHLQKALVGAFGDGTYFKFQDVKDLAEGMQTMDVQVASEDFGEEFQNKLSKALTQAFGEKIAIKYADEDKDSKISSLEERIAELEERLSTFQSEDEDLEDEAPVETEEDKKKKEQMRERLFTLQAKLKKYELGDIPAEDTKDIPQDGMENMSPEEKAAALKEKAVAALREEIVQLQEQMDKDQLIATLKEQVDGLKQQLGEKEKVVTAAAEETAKLAEAKWQQDVETFIAKGESEGKILPQHKEFVKLLLQMAKGSNMVQKFTESEGKQVDIAPVDVVKKYVTALPSLINFAEISDQGQLKTFTQETELRGEKMPVQGAELANEALAYSEKHKVPYDVALIEVEKQNKK